MSDKNKLYNEAQKLRYINKKESEVTLAPNFLNNLFTKSALFEEKYGKDLCQWTVDEIIAFYKFSDSRSLDSLTLINSNYAMYTNWCLSETLVPDGQNHFLEVDYNVMMNCVNTSLVEKTIITREELEERADTLLNYTDRFVFYALFEGICGKQFEEITKAKPSDISGNVIHLCTGRIVAITSKLREVAESAAAEEIYQSYGENGYGYKYRADDEYICKMVNNKRKNDGNDDKNRAQVLGRRYVNAVNYAGLPRQLTPKRLMVSGKIDYIKRIMQREGLPLEETLRKHREEIDYIYPVERLKSIPLFVKKYQKIIEKQLRNQNL